MGLIFDLDQTLIDSSIADSLRKQRNWTAVYRLIDKFTSYPGIIDSIRQFKMAGFKICIVTSSPRSYCERVLNYWSIPHDFTICYHDTTYKKPHPQPILKAIKLIGKPANQILSFGDRDIDIIASNEASSISVACIWGADDVNSLLSSSPVHIIRNADDLVDLVNLTRRTRSL